MAEHYNTILSKIDSLKTEFPSLRNKENDYIFSVLVLKNSIYKNPSLVFDESVIKNSIIDGTGDGGVDILLNDPNSETSDLLICQSKFYASINFDEISDAIHKMIDFYNNMKAGIYTGVNDKVKRRFIDVDAEVGEESKIKFIFYTSSPKNNIRKDRLSKIVKEAFRDDERYILEVYFDSDVVDEIKEAESRRPNVENGTLCIDKTNNILLYSDESAAIVNISAFSLKQLYILNSINLFSQNLRYFVKKKEIDKDINKTINEDPDGFWFKNNGITIVCEKFDIDGKELKLKKFSIVNGGQTTTLISKKDAITVSNDFYIPCKVITLKGNSEDEKTLFSLEIAKATNSQKAIKAIDLKANAPEQVRFANEMREVGVFYKTKRGEVVPNDYKTDYKNTDLTGVGKACLASIFQIPAASRNKPSTMFNDQFYRVIFESNQKHVAKIAKDILYIDHYFRKIFIPKFDNLNEGKDYIPFAHNSRTICLSYVSLLSRIANNSLDKDKFYNSLLNTNIDKYYETYFYDDLINLENFSCVVDLNKYVGNLDTLDDNLYKLFDKLIREGFKIYKIKKASDPSLNETNYLKNDKNYYNTLELSWSELVIESLNNELFV